MGTYENHLQFAFPGPYTGSSLKFSTFAQEPTDIGNVVNYVKINGITANVDTNPVKVYVNQFASNIDSTVTSPLSLQTDYFTYMILDEHFVGSFRGNAALVPAPDYTFQVLVREPNRLDIEFTFVEDTGVPFDVFVQIGNNDFTGASPTFSQDLVRTFSFDQISDTQLIDTVSYYTAYVHVINAHGSTVTNVFEIPGTIGPPLTFDTFELVSMGNLDTDGTISLSVDLSANTSLSNVKYYVTAYSPGEGPETLLDMIQPEANVESGLLNLELLNNVVLHTDYRGNPFVEGGNVVVQGLMVHEDTNKHVWTEYTGPGNSITMDVPVIEANVFAAPMFKI